MPKGSQIKILNIAEVSSHEIQFTIDDDLFF